MGMKNKQLQQNLLTVGQVAEKTGVNRQTLLYYEREGLLAAPARKESGYRIYTADVLERVCFIKRVKKLGFSLDEVKKFLALTADNTEACQEAKNLTEQKLKDIESKLQALALIKKQLVELSASCDGKRNPEQCSILDAFTHLPKGEYNNHVSDP